MSSNFHDATANAEAAQESRAKENSGQPQLDGGLPLLAIFP